MHLDQAEFWWFAIYGAVGGVVGAMAKSRRLRLPRIIRHVGNDGERWVEVDVGFLVAPLLGAVVAAMSDGRPFTAVAWGLACGYAGPAIVNAIVDGLLKKVLGVDTEKLPHRDGGALDE